MPHDIIDNREVKLSEAVGLMLDNAARAKFAVGYFFLSGFKAIRPHLEKVDELRLLIGGTTSRETIEALALGLGSAEAAAKAIERGKYLTPAEKKDAVEEAAGALSKVAAALPQTDEDEDYIKHLARLVKEGKIKVRVYTKGVLHAKAYIVDYGEGRYETGSAIIGSSNLSLAGVTSNTELNVVVPGNENHAKLSKWFDGLWDESEDFDTALMNVLESSWAINEPSPYELYLKIVYELVRERLDEDEKVHAPREAVELYNYQTDAVLQARSILKDYGGVFLCDVVGLGKTYMGAALLADHYARTGEKPLVICPPVIKPQWEYVCDLYDLPVEVVSRGKIADIEENDRLMKRPIVLVDESHHFRHPYTQGYKSLERICWKKKVVLVTATPYNTEARDILHQMRLFHPSEVALMPIDPPTLTEYFRAVESGVRKLPDLLEHVMVRRTRRHIEKDFPEDMKSGKLSFPKRLPPVRIDYSIDETYPGIYEKIEKLLRKIKYARYDLYHYVKPEHRDDVELSQLKVAGKNLVALMKTMLFKRMESSVAAFRRSVSDQTEIHGLYLSHLKKGYVPAGLLAEELARYRGTGDEEKLQEIMEVSAEKYPADRFDTVRMIEDIEADLGVYKEIHALVKDLKPEDDAKLQTLLEYLGRSPLDNGKVLIFTEFAATADYLGGQIAGRYTKADWVSGGSRDILDKVKRFAPKANRAKVLAADEIRILVTTDILSEGLNLQDCNIVVSYDLHWNPVRLIQRIGRVDRVSTEHGEIHTYNFFPERKLESKLGLEERLSRRIDEIHKHLGLDAKYLSQSEQLSDVKLFKRIYTGDAGVLDEPEDESEVSFAELVKMLRDLRAKDPVQFKKVAILPDKMRSAKAAPESELAVFCKAGDYAALYLADDTGKIVSQDQMDILKKLKCEPDTKRLALPPGFNAKVREIERQFQEDAAARLAERHSVAAEPIVKQTLKQLNTLARKAKPKDKKTITELRQKLESVALSPSQKSGLRKLQKQVNMPDEHIEALRELLLAQQMLDFGDRKRPRLDSSEVVVQVIASEALMKG